MALSFLLVYFLTILFSFGSIHAQEGRKAPTKGTPALSCDEFLPAKKQVGENRIGPEECKIVSEEVVFNIKGQRYQRLELRISGSVEGWAAKQGPRFNYFNDAPDIVFTQSGNVTSRFKGIGRYGASTGHGISLFFPENPAHWNGKVVVTAHGAGPYGAVRTLLPRDPKADFNSLTNVNRYVGLMMDRGYAVAHTLRSTQLAGGDITVTLEDGTTLQKYNISSHAGFMREFKKIAVNVLQKKMGRKLERAYFYGFSAGGFLGRLIQYQPGFNRDDDGRPLFDGFLLDDAGGGLWLPILMVDGKDTLFVQDNDKKSFVHQIDITHQLYAGDTNDFVQKKRENAKLLKQKGLASKHRMYEVRGVSHFDAGQVSLPELVPQTLDLGGLVESLIDALDQWVEKGKEPPSTKSDLLELGDINRDSVNENPAIAFPEVACPLGVYYIFPAAQQNSRRAGQETAFAAFDGVNLEPIDARGEFVDMNGNGVRDKRETVVQAWKRLGLLKPTELFTRSKYITCVTNAAAKLVEEGLLPPPLLAYYMKKAMADGVGEVEP
jgi:Alpha/beta hydrolase domain